MKVDRQLSSLFIPARGKDMMGGAPAAVLDHEADLKMEVPRKAENVERG